MTPNKSNTVSFALILWFRLSNIILINYNMAGVDNNSGEVLNQIVFFCIDIDRKM